MDVLYVHMYIVEDMLFVESWLNEIHRPDFVYVLRLFLKLIENCQRRCQHWRMIT